MSAEVLSLALLGAFSYYVLSQSAQSRGKLVWKPYENKFTHEVAFAPVKESFSGGFPVDAKRSDERCGVDLPSCEEGTRCINGFCRSTEIKPLPKTGLPVYP